MSKREQKPGAFQQAPGITLCSWTPSFLPSQALPSSTLRWLCPTQRPSLPNALLKAIAIFVTNSWDLQRSFLSRLIWQTKTKELGLLARISLGEKRGQNHHI
jgi:hypothetical protein